MNIKINKNRLKKVIVISLLFLFLLQCGIKTIIVVGFYAQRDYISKTLCENRSKPTMHCNGKCYLNKQLKKEQKNENNLPAILKTTSEVFIYHQTDDLIVVHSYFIVEHFDNYFIKPYHHITVEVFRPPMITS
jgi:hypothetical protein